MRDRRETAGNIAGSHGAGQICRFYLQLQINAVISVMRDSDRLFVQWNWQRKISGLCKDEMEFVSKAGKIHIRFMASGTAPLPRSLGRVADLICGWNGSMRHKQARQSVCLPTKSKTGPLTPEVSRAAPPDRRHCQRHPNFHEMSDFLSEATRKHLSRMREKPCRAGRGTERRISGPQPEWRGCLHRET